MGVLMRTKEHSDKMCMWRRLNYFPVEGGTKGVVHQVWGRVLL